MMRIASASSVNAFLIDEQGRRCQLVTIAIEAPDRRTLTGLVETCLDVAGVASVSRPVAPHQFHGPDSGAIARCGYWVPYGPEHGERIHAARLRIEHAGKITCHDTELRLALFPEHAVDLRSLGKPGFPCDPYANVTSVQGNPFNIDAADYVCRHDVIFEAPPADWLEGQIIGNGDLCGIVEMRDSLEVTFTKNDVWPRDKQGVALGKVHLGKLRIGLEGFGGCASFRQSLHPAEGSVSFAVTDAAGQSIQGKVWIAARTPDSPPGGLAVVEFNGCSNGPGILRVDLQRSRLPRVRRWISSGDTPVQQEQVFDIAPALTAKAGQSDLIIRHEFPNMCYTLHAGITGTAGRTESEENDAQVAARFRGEVKGNFRTRIQLAAVTSLESADCASEAARRAAGRDEQPEQLARDSRKAWNAFWSQSHINIPDKFIENVWYLSLYHMACVSGGHTAPSFIGAWWGADFAPWRDCYTSDSQCQMDHWGVFAANHIELAISCLNTYGRMIPFFMEHADGNGLQVPHMFFPQHAMIDLTDTWHAYYPGCTPWLAQTFLWLYEFTDDNDYLRSFLYPVLVEIEKYFATHFREDARGTIHVHGGMPEQPGNENDNPFNLALARLLLRALVDHANAAGATPANKAAWAAKLARIADYPQDAETVWESRDESHPHRAHPSVFFACYPGDEIGAEYPLAYKFRNTLARTIRFWARRYGVVPQRGRGHAWGGTETAGHAIFWLAAAAARLDNGDLCRDLIYNPGLLCLLKPQGLLAHAGIPEPSWFRAGTLDSAGCFLSAVNEMLLRDRGNVIRIFPAMPRDWEDSRFANLRARKAFLVSAELRKREVVFFSIRALAGGPCTVRNPWPADGLKCTASDGNAVRADQAGENWTFLAAAGMTYTLEPSGRHLPDRRRAAEKHIEPARPRMLSLQDLRARSRPQTYLGGQAPVGQDAYRQDGLAIGIPKKRYPMGNGEFSPGKGFADPDFHAPWVEPNPAGRP